MRKDWELTEEAFDKFLYWLNPEREKAGKKYEEIRHRLIIILACRGCAEAEELADESINRVIQRAQEMAPTYQGDPAPYFITVAHRVHLEYIEKRQKLSELPPELPQPQEPDPEEEREYECLELCVQGLIPANRELVLQYYQDNKQAKIEHRKRLADEMGIALNALRIRACRIRASLEQCIDECLTSASAHEMDRGQNP